MKYKRSQKPLFPSIPLLLTLLLAQGLTGCGGAESADYTSTQSTPSRGDWVIVRAPDDPESLNPYLSQSALAGHMVDHHLYQPLFVFHPETHRLLPVLVDSLAERSADQRTLTYTLRPEAHWDPENPVTVEDVLFTFKVIKNPYVNTAHRRLYFDFVENVEPAPDSPRSFQVHLKFPYVQSEAAFAMFELLPRQVLDPEGELADFSLQEIAEHQPENGQATNAELDRVLQVFAERYNSAEYGRDPLWLQGSGPYKLAEWKTGRQLVFERKRNWWADSLLGVQFAAYPDKIVYKIINDPNTASVALQNQEIDVYWGIAPKDFVLMQKDENLQQHYTLSSPNTFVYTYLGLNLMPPAGRAPLFTDRRVRRAFAHLLDVDLLIDKINYGYAERITGPTFPLAPQRYDSTLPPIPFDAEKAVALLDEAGWRDQDGDGIRDKTIDGRLVPFRCEFLLHKGNPAREHVARILQENARKVGCDVELVVLDWSLFLQRTLQRQFDLYYGGWTGSPAPQDLKQIWHTSSIQGGSNFVGFGNEESDQLIEATRNSTQPAVYNPLYRKFHRLVYREQPYVFLMLNQTPVAIHKRFRNAQASNLRPGCFPARFWTPTELTRYGNQ